MVSIVVPIYNVRDYLDGCIGSITAQTYSDIEIILVDDGSTDGSDEICRKWEEKDPRITLIAQNNRGVAAARNAGIVSSRGEWLCFVDGDDRLETDAVEKLIAEAERGHDVVLCDYSIDTEKGKKRQEFFCMPERVLITSDERLELIRNCFLKTKIARRDSATAAGVPWARIFRTELIRENAITYPEQLRKMQDAIFCAKAFACASSVSYIKSNLYIYELREGSVTHKTNKNYPETAKQFLEEMKLFMSEYGFENDLRPVYNARKMMFLFETIKFRYLMEKETEPLSKRIRFVKQTLQGVSYSKEEKKEMRPYLGRAYTIALKLYEKNMYLTLYLMMAAYQKYREKKLSGFSV